MPTTAAIPRPRPCVAQVPDRGDDHERLQRHVEGGLETGSRGRGRADEEQEQGRQQDAKTAARQGGAAGSPDHGDDPSVAAISAGIR